MSTKIYVGGLNYEVTDETLKEMFAAFGDVESAVVINDRDSGKSKGFGFVEMTQSDDAQKAITTLNAKEIDGRKLTVNQARPREDRR